MNLGLVLAVSAALVGLSHTAFAQPPALDASPDFPGCEWRLAEEHGAAGRSALFCKSQFGSWQRVNIEGLAPGIVAKAAGGDVHAMAILGAAYHHRSVRGPEDGKALLERAAQKGDASAMRELGYLHGAAGSMLRIVPAGATKAEIDDLERQRQANEDQAMSYYKQAAALGDTASMRMLALHFDQKAPGDALNWTRRGAEAGDPEAMVDLAYRLVDHEGKTGDPVAADKWLRAAAAASDIHAMYVLSSNYQSGSMGVKADKAQAALWEARADAAYVEDLKDRIKRDGLDLDPSTFGRTEGPGSELGEIYLEGRRGVTKDPAEGLRWLELAADHGDEQAALTLASTFTDGGRAGVPPDPAKAAKWEAVAKALEIKSLVAGAEQGNVDMMKQLAKLYLDGRDSQETPYLTVQKDAARGVTWLRKASAAAPDDPEVMMNLAAVYREGVGVDKDAEAARGWQAKAAAIDPVRFGDLDAVIATLDQQEPFAAIMVVGRLGEAGRPDEAVFWYYVGQLRGRMQAETDSTAAQAYGAVFASIGPGMNEYAMGNIAKFVAMVDRVLAWDEAHPLAGVSPSTRARQRKGLEDLKAYVLKNQDKIRRERKKNGLPN